jgi:phosphoserine phosphatase
LLIATLIAAGRLDDRLLAEAIERVPGARFAQWVEEGDAVDLEVPDRRAREQLEGWNGCDIIVQPADGREKQLLAADMDSTIIGQECIDELADYAGIKPSIAAITERAMRGEIDFAEALKARVALLEGLDVAIIARCLDERIRPNPGAETLVRTMRERGAGTILLSGGFVDFVEPVAALVGFELHAANLLAKAGSELTGELEGPIVDAEAKKAAMIFEREERSLEVSAVLAIGDGANDVPLVEAAGLGVAYRAKPALIAVADARLDHHGLDALLWAQGIARKDWVIEPTPRSRVAALGGRRPPWRRLCCRDRPGAGSSRRPGYNKPVRRQASDRAGHIMPAPRRGCRTRQAGSASLQSRCRRRAISQCRWLVSALAEASLRP